MTKKPYIINLFLIALFLLPSLASAESELFTRYLQKGDSGADVLILQKVMNTDPETQVSASGKGSPGLETEFFGELTKQAVIKYQKKNALGNKYGFFTLYSGALDDRTRASLNGKVDEAQQTIISTSTPATASQQRLNEIYRASNASSSTPFIQNIDPETAKNGDYITINGRNFSTSTPNIVRMTYNSVTATSSDGTTLRVRVQSSLQNMFEKEADDLDEDEKDSVREKMSELPLFLTIQNINGISNAYQIYLKIR